MEEEYIASSMQTVASDAGISTEKITNLSQQSRKKMRTLTIAISDTGRITPLELLLEWGRADSSTQ